MAQADGVVANGTGAAVRSDLNGQLAALFTNHSGSTEPGTTYAYQWWADTNANVLKIRNSSNDGWITLRELDGTMLIEDGSASSPGLAFADDTDTGLFSSAANQLQVATAGVERVEIGSTGIVFNDPGNDVDFRVESNGNTHMLFVDAGNDRVGIGTSSPDGQLTLPATASNTPALRLQSTTSNSDIAISSYADSTGSYAAFGANHYLDSSGNDAVFDTNIDSSAIVLDGRNKGAIQFLTAATGIAQERARIDSSGRLLVGTSSATDYAGGSGYTPKFQFKGSGEADSSIAIANSDGNGILVIVNEGGSSVISDDEDLGKINFKGYDGNSYPDFAQIKASVDGTPGDNDCPGRLTFSTTADGASSPTERLRINSEGKIQVTGTRGGSLQPSDNDSLELFTSASSASANTGCGLTFYNNDGNGYEMGGTIQVAKENSSINNTAGYMRFCTRPNAAGPVERMRIGSGGDVLISRTSASISNVGHYFLSVGAFNHTRSGDTVGEINRLANDGTLINFRQADSVEGSISVSGSTVSYNGGHLARWSQLASGAARTEILRGSVLSNLDEMCEWAYDAQDAVLYTEEDDLPEGVSVGDVKTPAKDAGTEDNEQLNRMKVSDVEGDVNVSGVFQAWDDDDDTYTNDFYCAMTGDFVIRIAQGTTVARGDLLMSAGDGTAKPQDDDIVRSKTIAKVTSTTVSTTYSDGSYCVPCVLMAC